MLRLNRRHVYWDNVAPFSGTKARGHKCARGRHPISMRGKWRLMCILAFFKMKTLLQLFLAQKLISSKCIGLLFKNNLLQSDTVPLIITQVTEWPEDIRKLSGLYSQLHEMKNSRKWYRITVKTNRNGFFLHKNVIISNNSWLT